MDNEQIKSRLDWLDEERRKDKVHIAELIKKVNRLESTLGKNEKSIKDVGRNMSSFEIKLEKIKELKPMLDEHKKTLKNEVNTLSKTMIRREREERKLVDRDIKRIDKSIEQVKKKQEEISVLKADMTILEAEDQKVAKRLYEMDQKLREFADHDVENTQTIKLYEEDRRKDNLKVIDLTGEISAVRKRIDEYSTRSDLNLENQKRTEKKIDEVVKVSGAQEQAQRDFIENVERQMVNQKRELRQWEMRFEEFEGQISTIDPFIEKITLAEKDVRKAQQSFEDIMEKIERRINEITEMQRLGEERFRNEWATFRASDHKRWTNYSMAEEEKQRESTRLIGKIEKTTSNLIDDFEELKEIQKFLLAQSESRAQKLFELVGEMAADSERFRKGLE